MNERCSTVLLNKLTSKEKDPRSFTIPCDIGQLHIDNALADLGASISLMPYTMYKKLGFYENQSNKNDGFDSENSIRRIDYVKNEHLYSASANEIDEKKPELKNLPQHIEYAYLHGDKSFPIIISFELSEKEKISLLQVLEKQKGAIAWNMSDIKGIIQDVVKNKIVKLLDSGLIYPISDSSWVSPIHVAAKREGMRDRKQGLLGGFYFSKDLTLRLRIKKGAENLAADHLSRLENPDLGTFTEEEITDGISRRAFL
ncbi:DNA-directed DNA polymerase [Tanacetum coccineum]